ncbi:MAG TPA: AAA domain-containing protein [Actinomycetes bacterium]|jgi:hypothetical protein|nr:AAA domain-containing protein [Actinomycetes bacterium]
MRTGQSASSDLVVRLFGDDKKSTYHGRYTFPAREGRIVEATSSYVLLKVRDLDQEMPVTLKVYDLREVQGDARELARSMWQSEVRALMQLVPYQWKRPGLVRFVEGDWDEPTDTLFVAWENAYRYTLADLLQDEAVEASDLQYLPTRVDMFVLLVEALYELHAHGIIHRELTPRAVCVWDDRTPRVALTHFGMSIFLNSFLWAPTPDAFNGGGIPTTTLGYSAPERLAFLSSDTADIVQAGEDYRQDIFSLGLIMTEWLTEPFDAGTFHRFLFLPDSQPYNQYDHLDWVLEEVYPRVDRTALSNDREAESRLKDLLRRMVAFDPGDRFTTAGQLVRATRDVQALFRQRSYRKLCEKPFKLVFAPRSCAEHLDLSSPREYKRAELDRNEQIRTISDELQADLDHGPIRVGADDDKRWGRDPAGKERWLLRGHHHLYRLETFRSRADGNVECPWLAYLFQVVRGAASLEKLTVVPFEKLVVLPLEDARRPANRGRDPGDTGRWDELLEHLRRAQDEPWQHPSSQDDVVMAAFEEALAVQEAAPDANTYAVDLVSLDQPDGPLGTSVAEFRSAPARDEAFVEGHPYIRLFESTTARRLGFESWCRGLRDGARVQLAAMSEQLRFRRVRVDGVIEHADPVTGVVRVQLPPGSAVCPSQGFVRVADESEDTLRRQRRALGRMEGDAYRLELLSEPGLVNVSVPVGELDWRTPLEPDSNKRKALEACLKAYPAFFLQGPPGTGKTATATEIIAQVMAANRASRVLVSAQANEALDNLMENVLDNLPHKGDYLFLRVRSGTYEPKRDDIRARQPLPAIQAFCDRATNKGRGYLRYLEQQQPDVAEKVRPIIDSWHRLLGQRHSDLERIIYRSANLVFATCLGADQLDRHGVTIFDWAVVEEAARAHPTELLIPLLKAQRWILIGDHLQLQPFKAEVFGAAFKKGIQQRLQDRQEQADADQRAIEPYPTLTEQSDRYLALFSHMFQEAALAQRATLTAVYRMHPSICELIDRLFYRPGDDGQRLLEPALPAEERTHPYRADWAGTDWLASKAVVWLDTSQHRGRRERLRGEGETSCENPLEAEIVDRLLRRLADQDSSLDVLLLSVYRRQRERLSGIAESHPQARALTVIASQGKEADVVIVSLARSNTEEVPGRSIGQIRDDYYLNVALSRAKRLLIVVGDAEHFAGFGAEAGKLNKLLGLLRAWPDPRTAATVGLHQPLDLVPAEWFPPQDEGLNAATQEPTDTLPVEDTA